LGAILSQADFAGRAALLDQVDTARVIGGCDCGCATVDLAVEGAPPSHAIAYPIPNDATVLDAQGEIVGGMLVFVRDGYLAQLEVYGNDSPISPFPSVDRLRPNGLSR
jgi:hypothetical protein